MSGIIEKIKTRLPGGHSYEVMKTLQEALTGTEFEFVVAAYNQVYSKGRYGNPEQVFRSGIEKLKKDGYYDFGLVKLSILHGDQVFSEFMDLLVPTLIQRDIDIFEGPYEFFDVRLDVGDVVIDAGANIGVFSMYAAACKNAQVYAFEPMPYLAKEVEENALINGVESLVTVVASGLSDETGMCEILVEDNAINSATFLQEKSKSFVGGGYPNYSTDHNNRRIC